MAGLIKSEQIGVVVLSMQGMLLMPSLDEQDVR